MDILVEEINKSFTNGINNEENGHVDSKPNESLDENTNDDVLVNGDESSENGKTEERGPVMEVSLS